MRILVFLLMCSVSLPVSADIRFENESRPAGITRVGESWGNAWGDFDGDGYLDLWTTNHKQKPSLYRNNGDGTFTDIIDEVWDAYPYVDARGVAWADFDNDGDQDLIMLCSGSGAIGEINETHYNHLYVNENGTLVDRSAELGVGFPRLRSSTPLWLDVNKDGRLDLIVTGNRYRYPDGTLATNSLFEQTANGFEIANAQFGFYLEENASLAQISDITGDGHLDLLVNTIPYPSTAYDISVSPFDEFSSRVDIRTSNHERDVALADFDGDLYPDIFVARNAYSSYINFSNPYLLKLALQIYAEEKGVSFKTAGTVHVEIHSVWMSDRENLRIGEAGYDLRTFGGEFIETDPDRNVNTFSVILSADDPRVIGLSEPQPDAEGRSTGSIGYDPETGNWQMLYYPLVSFSGTTSMEIEVVIESTEPITAVESINFSGRDFANPVSRLLNNRGAELTYTISETFLDGCSVAAGDFDNDMDVDIYLVRSNSAGNLPNYIYENLGDNTFAEHTGFGRAAGSTVGKGQSVAMADYDRDGYLDLFVTNGRGIYPFNRGPDQLFRNLGGSNNWLQIDLEGTVSNRDGIGARVFANTPDGRTQLRENGGGIHWTQQDQKRLHFGLAENEIVSELAIHWPSGIIQRLTDVPVNQVLRVVEPNQRPAVLADVNEDGEIDLIDFVYVISDFSKTPPTNPRTDVNEDGVVDILDLVWVVAVIQGDWVRAAPYHGGDTGSSDLSATDMAALYGFYERLAEVPGSAADKAVIKRFLQNVLVPVGQPSETRLHANYPNPFNPETWIPYQLATDSEVTIRIYDTSGRVVRTLVSGHQIAGYYLSRGEAAYWDGRNALGESVASGVYIYELVTPTFTQTKRLVIRK